MEEKEDMIDMIGLLKMLLKGRKVIILCLILGIGIGIVISFFTPNEYTVSTVMVPQVSSNNKSQLSSLASLAGLDMGMSQSSDLSPLIYPKIVNSIPFKLELMNTPLHFKGFNKAITIYEYYTEYYKPSLLSTIKKYTIGLPLLIIKSIFKKENNRLIIKDDSSTKLIQLTKEQYQIKKILDGMIILQVEKKDGYLTLIVKMFEPIAAAELALKAQQLLQRDIIKFKIEKAQADLDFIEERFNIAKAQAEGYQVKIAVNNDRYKNLTSNLPQVSTSRVQTKFGIANSVYLELAKQLEQAKIQVKKDTPIFTVIEPVSVPLEQSGSGKLKILIIWLFIGGVIGVGLVWIKNMVNVFKQKWELSESV